MISSRRFTRGYLPRRELKMENRGNYRLGRKRNRSVDVSRWQSEVSKKAKWLASKGQERAAGLKIRMPTEDQQKLTSVRWWHYSSEMRRLSRV